MLVEFMFQFVFENYILVDPTSTTRPMYSAVSVLGCATLCRFPCSSFFFNRAQHQCVLANKIYEETHPDIKSAAGWKYYSYTGELCRPPYTLMTTENMCLKVETVTKLNYAAATAACAADGAHLFHLDTTAKINAWNVVQRAQYSNLNFYLGLSNLNYAVNNFRWTDGSAYTDNNWRIGQPDSSYNDVCAVILHSRDYQWDDLFCTYKFSYVCELP